MLSFIVGYRVHIVFIVSIILVTIVFRFIKKHIKSKYYNKFVSELGKDNNDDVIIYYEKRYIVDIFQVLGFVIIVVFYLHTMSVNFTFLSVAVGAMLIIVQPYIQSLLTYLILQKRFKIGDSIKVDDYLGDIIFMKPLYIGLAGRNDLGEHTGDVVVIPNNVFTTKVVSKYDIKSRDIRKNLITFVYNKSFTISYSELLSSMRLFLHETLPIRSIDECGPYKSYIGHKFKLHSKYEGSDLKITIGYLDSYYDSRESMEHIIAYIESLKE